MLVGALLNFPVQSSDHSWRQIPGGADWQRLLNAATDHGLPAPCSSPALVMNLTVQALGPAYCKNGYVCSEILLQMCVLPLQQAGGV